MKLLLLIFRRIFSVVLLFLFFFISHPLCSAYDWNKNQINPVISFGNSSWFHTQNPSIVNQNGQLLMLLEVNNGSGWRISKGTSQNGISWTVDTQPIIQTAQWDNQHSNPALIYNPILNQNQGWFTAYNSSNWNTGVDLYRMGYATSSAGINWSKYTEKWVLTGSIGTWDEGGIARGISVILINGIYHLWYTAKDALPLGTSWIIGYATSSDGINWTKHPNNPVIKKTANWEFENMMYPFVLYEDGKFKMWYGTGTGDHCTRYAYAESSNGYEWVKPADKNPVYDVSGVPGSFDQFRLAGHTRIRDENVYKIWYSGFDGTHWSIGYATSSADPILSTPTPTPIEPIIIVPGMMASWNKDGILEGQQNPATPWKLLPFVKEYDGLVGTLKNLGYEENKNLFLWPYDWRKSVASISGQLNQFIDSTVKPKNPGSKVHLVGHSLGGLVTRAWTQTNANKDLVHHLITVASPHKGTIQPYTAWEGGVVSQDNSFLSLASHIIVELNRRSFATTRQAVQSLFPVLKDLLPTENYLKRKINDSFISESDMKVRNSWLQSLNTNASPIYPILDTIRGVGFPQTPFSYTIVAPSWLDKALGNWQDGKPVSQDVSDGDFVIPSTRASLDDPSVFLPQNHSNTIASNEGVKLILQMLEIPASDSAIVSGKETIVRPGLLFLIRSPASMQVEFNSESFDETDGILFFPNAEAGVYSVSLTGITTGLYRFVVGQFIHNTYSWKEYVGTTFPGKITTYDIHFLGTVASEDPVINKTDKERLEEIDIQLAELQKLTISLSVLKARKTVQQAIDALPKQNYNLLKKQLELILSDLSSVRKSHVSKEAYLKTFAVADTLIDAFQAILSKESQLFSNHTIANLQKHIASEKARIEKALEKNSKRGERINNQAELLLEAENYNTKALNTTTFEDAKKYILLFQTQILLKEIRL